MTRSSAEHEDFSQKHFMASDILPIQVDRNANDQMQMNAFGRKIDS